MQTKKNTTTVAIIVTTCFLERNTDALSAITFKIKNMYLGMYENTIFWKSQKSFISMATILEFLLKSTVWSSNYGGYIKLLKVI